jgi:hypothetical protein
MAHAPQELTEGRLERLGEGIGKVVYASPHWVVKRERSTGEILSLILVWKLLRRLEKRLPGRWGRRLRDHPGPQLRLLRWAARAVVTLVPLSLWYSSHAGQVWRIYAHRGWRGEHLAVKHLSGTPLVPETITFPPARVRVGGWPGWLTVSEATERVEATLHERLAALAREGRYDQVETWLERLLELRRKGWQRGVYSVDAHLKNFGVIGERVVLLDAGGLTDHWEEVEQHLEKVDRAAEPHAELGLREILRDAPGVASRFNARWKEAVNAGAVRAVWPR